MPSVQVEYFLLNLPETMKNPEFLKLLSLQINLDIFDELPIRTIIDFKFFRYTRNYFLVNFGYFLVFLAAYLVDLHYLILNEIRDLYIQLILKCIAASYLLVNLAFEIKQLSKLGFRKYMPDFWNVFDIFIIGLYIAIIIVDT